tara:strand:- start:60 stop:308 length:249 start_codon:yes stop_codon:yes gene_type:complete
MGIAYQLQEALWEQDMDGDWSDKDEAMVVRRYRHSSDEERDLINSCLTAMCGYSFATLASQAGYCVTPLKKQNKYWETQKWE